MIFHFAFELPPVVSRELDHETPYLTTEEIRILKKQVRLNSVLVNEYVGRLDLLVNKERYPPRAIFIQKIRRRLEILMEENDNFRKTLWKQEQQLNTDKKVLWQ